MRDWGPPFRQNADGSRDASYFLGVNRNKRSVSLDLAHKPGQEILRGLLAGADILIENFRPGTMERWGLGYDDILAKEFPQLVHCRVSGFGAHGQMGGLPGYDAVLQAYVGLMSINGDVSSGPMRGGTAVIDMATGLYSAVAILMALHERTRSGKGQFIDMTLYDCGLTLLHPHLANYLLDGRRPTGTGNPHPNIAPYESYSTRSGTIFIAAGNEAQFRKLCALLAIPNLPADPRFGSNADRVENRDALRSALSTVLAHEEAEELAIRLLRGGVPAGAVRSIDSALAAPHTAERDMLWEVDGWRGTGTPIKFSRTPGRVHRAPPTFGQHTDEVLQGLGYGPDEIEQLRRSGTVVSERRG